MFRQSKIVVNLSCIGAQPTNFHDTKTRLATARDIALIGIFTYSTIALTTAICACKIAKEVQISKVVPFPLSHKFLQFLFFVQYHGRDTFRILSTSLLNSPVSSHVIADAAVPVGTATSIYQSCALLCLPDLTASTTRPAYSDLDNTELFCVSA